MAPSRPKSDDAIARVPPCLIVVVVVVVVDLEGRFEGVTSASGGSTKGPSNSRAGKAELVVGVVGWLIDD